MARRCRLLVSRARQRTVGIRRGGPHAATRSEHQRCPDSRARPQVHLALGRASARLPRTLGLGDVRREIMGNARSELIAALAEVFREHGFHGASLDLISRRTGLGKGSLYHAFPGGKEQMAAEVLANIDAWFEQNVFTPLRDDVKPLRAIVKTLDA